MIDLRDGAIAPVGRPGDFENVGTKTRPVFTAGRFLRTPSGERLHGDLCMPRAIACDWDHDGRKDIIMTEEDSRVGWCRNTGAVKNGLPVFTLRTTEDD